MVIDGFKIVEVNSLDEFSSIKQEWKKLVTNKQDKRFFETYEFIKLVYKSFLKEEDKLLLLLIYEGKTLISLVPLVVLPEKRFFVNVRVIKLVAEREGDLPDAIGRADNVIMGVIKKYLTEHFTDWDIFEKAECRDDKFLEHWVSRKFFTAKLLDSDSGQAQMNETFDEYLKTLSKSVKKQFKRAKNRIDKNSLEIKIEHIEDKSKLHDGLKRFLQLERVSRKSGKDLSIHVNPERVKFYHDLMDIAVDEGRMVFSFLMFNDKRVAAIMDFVWNDVGYLLHMTYDPAYNYYSPGIVLREQHFKYLHQSGLRVIDMLATPAPLPEFCHKRGWTGQRFLNYRLFIIKLNFSTLPFMVMKIVAKIITKFKKN